MNMFASKKPAAGAAGPDRPGSSDAKGSEPEPVPELSTLIANKDYMGAVTVLQFKQQTGDGDAFTLPWIGYAAFHLGNFALALSTYETLLKSGTAEPVYHLYQAASLYYLGRYAEAKAAALKGPTTKLQNRLLLHCAFKLGDDAGLAKHRAALTADPVDVLSGCASLFNRTHFQEATDGYQQTFKDNPDYDALNLYIALCCYKLDHFKFSLEFVHKYLQRHPHSAAALNLKACNHFRLMDVASAEAELKTLTAKTATSSHALESDVVKHNLVVFRQGEDALTHLPPMLDHIPEARFNLVVHHLRQGALEDAHKLVRDLDPKTPQDYIIKGTAIACLSVDEPDSKHAEDAIALLMSVGSSASERDTIAGRKCMAQVFVFRKRWEDALLYLTSIEPYCSHDSVFNYNFGIALASTEDWKEAQRRLSAVTDEGILADPAYVSWLIRSHVMNGDPARAWALYDAMERAPLDLLALLATDCYLMGHFYHAFLAYEALYRIDPGEETWAGKRGAACGVLQMVVARRESPDRLREVIGLMRKHAPESDESDEITQVLTRWAIENGINTN